ncbi:[FeFe] hydrogenase H-cluster radical SAM maturase HydE [Anaerotignum sp.]|uniref:[FeFe] hydrogenase H-cluster radical SAM maturase HydE n=1 Tax=Anaerotignum sp. TaxID=2039241 RepID=UPI002714DB9F|nr:[FeFe] hydrogenase H-cluster radical SAM maturase HydE [Anaerotignum sp.]
MKELIDNLYATQQLEPTEFKALIEGRTPELAEYLFDKANQIKTKHYSNDIYIRGLIEFTNYCKNDCYYCGIRKSNTNAQRYRLTEEEILNCCETGYALGFRTFVLQGGEDLYFSDDKLVHIIASIKKQYSDCAITLSIGERSYESYLAFYNAGAERYLLRHETADEEHYKKLHPQNLTLSNRKACLFDLKQIGFQIGCGFMVGSPFQTVDNLVEDLVFIKELQPHMVGIGPFIPHHETPFANEAGGSLELTLFMLGLIRLMVPEVLLPSTTALGTIDPLGREQGILAGANVVMPNLSPISVRNKYMLYDNKICTGDEAAECRFCMQKRMENIGYQVVVSRGDHFSLQ